MQTACDDESSDFSLAHLFGQNRPAGGQRVPLAARDASGTRLDLIRVSPGMALPEHGHSGREVTLVLQGAFTDAVHDYHVGDLAEGDIEMAHRPLALDGEDCICLIATTGRLRARSVFARLLQPVFGV